MEKKNIFIGMIFLDEEGISLSGLCGWTDYLGRGRNCNVCKWWSFKYLFLTFSIIQLIFYIWPDCYSQNMSQSLADSISLFCCCWIGRFAILSGSVGRIVMPAVSKSETTLALSHTQVYSFTEQWTCHAMLLAQPWPGNTESQKQKLGWLQGVQKIRFNFRFHEPLLNQQNSW